VTASAPCPGAETNVFGSRLVLDGVEEADPLQPGLGENDPVELGVGLPAERPPLELRQVVEPLVGRSVVRRSVLVLVAFLGIEPTLVFDLQARCDEFLDPRVDVSAKRSHLEVRSIGE